MTILAAEAAESAGEAAASSEAAAGAQEGRSLGSRAREKAGERARQLPGQYAGQAGYVAQQGVLTPGRRTYQSVILAEFLVAIVIVALAPVARGGSPESKTKGSPSPYSVNNLRQLVALGFTYFVLAIVPGEQGSRIAAALGGLLLLVILMRAVSSGSLTAVVKMTAEPQETQPGGVQVL